MIKYHLKYLKLMETNGQLMTNLNNYIRLNQVKSFQVFKKISSLNQKFKNALMIFLIKDYKNLLKLKFNLLMFKKILKNLKKYNQKLNFTMKMKKLIIILKMNKSSKI